MTFDLTKGGKLGNVIMYNFIGPIRVLNIVCVASKAHMQCLTQHAFPHLLEQRTSF